MAGLKLYGENAFTFRFFDYLVARGKVPALLRELKSMADPRQKYEGDHTNDAAPDVWLFPCFGKRAGFGEPDAVIVIGERVFWFEVETSIELDETGDKGRDAFRQLARFHYAAVALSSHPTRQKGYLTYAGPTIDNRDKRKDARLRLRDHGARELLKSFERAHEHHHVLFTIDQPSARNGWRDTLQHRAREWFTRWDQDVGCAKPFRLDRAWYAYWRGDFNRCTDGHDVLGGYVSIKRSLSA